jgi:hypothetical protein
VDDPNAPAKTETLYDESKQVAYKPDTTMARASMTSKARGMSVRFFIFAALNLLEFMGLKSVYPVYAAFSLLAGFVFLAVGIYAFKVHRNAFLAAAGVYALQILWRVYLAFNTSAGIFGIAISLVIKCMVLWQIYQIYVQLVELHNLEEGHWD